MRGVKAMKSKNRIRFTVCTNATGTLIRPPLVIGKTNRPKCFDFSNEQDEVQKLYKSQQNSGKDCELSTYVKANMLRCMSDRRQL